MKHIITPFCLSLGLFLSAQSKAQETFSDTAITASPRETEKTGRFGRSWMQQQRERRANRRRNGTMPVLSGSTISAEQETAQATNAYRETPEKGWTPLHQRIYNDLIAGKVTDALQSARKLKKEGGSVDVPVPHDIDRRTLHAVAFDANREFFNGSLELNPNWPNLIDELQSED